jgi:hypothetical protein
VSGIGERSHQANATAAVDEINPAPGEAFSHLPRGIRVQFVVSVVRTTEDTNTHFAYTFSEKSPRRWTGACSCAAPSSFWI